MADNTVSVDVELAIKKATADLEKLTGRFDTFASKAEKGIGGVDKKLGFMRLTLVDLASEMAGKATQAVLAYAGAMVRNGIKAAKEYEDALNGFNVALQLSGNYSAEASKDFEDFAASIQQTTKFSDDATLSAGALIANISGLGGAPLKNATQNALDLAAALKIDLQTAAQLVGKAAVGETGTLSRYGIILGETGTKAEKAAAALALIQNKFGGAAVKDAETYSGAIAKASNNFGDLEKEIGFLVTKNPVLIKAIGEASKLFAKLTGDIEKNKTNLNEFVSKAVIKTVEGLGWLLKVGDGTIRFFQAFGQTVMLISDLIVSAFIGSIALILTAAEGTIGKVFEVLGKENPFSAFAEAARSTVSSSADGIIERVNDIGKSFSEEGALGQVGNFVLEAAARLEKHKADVQNTNEENTKNAENSAKKQARWWAWLDDEKTKGALKSLGIISTLQSSKNRELFNVGKAAAIATATINTFQGVSEAWKLGPILGPILAPFVAVAGAVQVAGIASTQPGFATGGVVGGNSLQGDNVPIRVNSREAVMTLEQQQNLFDIANGASAGGGGGITVIVEGNVIADSPSRIDELAEAISQRVRFNNTPLYASAVV